MAHPSRAGTVPGTRRRPQSDMRLYYHKTGGGAEYLTDTFIECPGGHKEGHVNGDTRYLVRIDGDITQDAELTDRNNPET